MKKCMSTNIIITNTIKMNAIAAADTITTTMRTRSTSTTIIMTMNATAAADTITLSLIHI